jgi:hypothetical protein
MSMKIAKNDVIGLKLLIFNKAYLVNLKILLKNTDYRRNSKYGPISIYRMWIDTTSSFFDEKL